MKHCADLFCGAGGTSTGLLLAAAELGLNVDLLAVNHWSLAIDTHTANHPQVRHLCESLDHIDPTEVIPGGRLELLCASPECTHHSRARGGKPRSDQSRASAWKIIDWVSKLHVKNLLIENVAEFVDWAPLTKAGKPMKRRKGKTFQAFLAALRCQFAHVEWKILNCADYGDATTRKRLFIMCRRSKRITWPAPTHAGQWRAAREVIDWSLEGRSIYGRKKPLSENTRRRIEAGLRKFGGEKFCLQIDHTGGGNGCLRSADQPLGTLVTKENVALAEPFIVHLRGTHPSQVNSSARSVDAPLPALTTSGAHVGLAEPFLLKYHGSHKGRNDGDARNYPLDEPLPTLDTSNRIALVQPFVIGQQSCAAARPVSEPLPTVATAGAIALVEPFLVKYYGTGGANSVTEPLDTVTTRDRFGLCQPEVEIAGERYRLDVRFRMLQPHELSAAMGFPADYQFSGNREARVKQIGNAVPVRTAMALCKELLR